MLLLLLACRATGDAKTDDAADDAHDGDTDDDCAGIELCDGIDNDCDGAVDEDVAETFYADKDGDGYGDLADTTAACEQPPAYLTTGNDCDDTDAGAFPGNPEVCDEVDNNCDGVVDEDVANTYFPDADGDGFGDPGGPRPACEEPEGYVADATDCDDTASGSNPAATEVCDEHDNDCDGTVDNGVTLPFYADYDGDGFGDDDLVEAACLRPSGFAEDPGDCDDDDPTVFPTAAETCNGVDDDCDEAVDDGAVDAPAWYADIDGDGYGDAVNTAFACEAPGGFVGNPDDCDDGLASVSPVASEYCNGYDDDCDSETDEDSALDAATWYLDYDGDGAGGSRITIVDCTAPTHYVAGSTDCDDDESSVFPGATETCNEVDDDCDGTVDDGAPGTDWYTDADGDGYGNAASVVTECDAPAGTVADGTDCDDGVATTYPGATEVCDGVDDDCDGTADDGAAGIYTFYADADGDSYGDPDTSVVECTAPADHVEDASDCDDADDTINPAAAETCDGVDEDCDGTVDDSSCHGCDVETYGGGTYLFCGTAVDWYTAQSNCRSWGYDLITIEDSGENSFAVSEGVSRGWTSSNWVAWIGYNDISSEGSWSWSGGGGSGYTNWNSGEPNNSGNEDCTELYTSYTWNDLPCSITLQYICED